MRPPAVTSPTDMPPARSAVTVTVSEKLLTTPFFSLVRTNASPISVALTKQSDTTYRGSFAIDADMDSGFAYATFSGRDLIGNRGTEIDSGGVILIDTEGPRATSLSVTPSAPIRNSVSAPVSVSVVLAFGENDAPVDYADAQVFVVRVATVGDAARSVPPDEFILARHADLAGYGGIDQRVPSVQLCRNRCRGQRKLEYCGRKPISNLPGRIAAAVCRRELYPQKHWPAETSGSTGAPCLGLPTTSSIVRRRAKPT